MHMINEPKEVDTDTEPSIEPRVGETMSTKKQRSAVDRNETKGACVCAGAVPTCGDRHSVRQ